MKNKILLLIFFLISFFSSFSQLPYDLIDQRDHKYCEGCQQVIRNMPHEVLFGIQINENGDVYFSMNNRQWFDKIFKNDSYGVTVDIVSKDRYMCNKIVSENYSLPKGTILSPIYRPDLLKGITDLEQGSVFTKIGRIQASLKNKQIEGNLMILNGNFICYYTSLINIPRDTWHLLPMGLFTDSLLNEIRTDNNGEKDFFIYTKKVQLQIPFSKSGITFSNNYLKAFHDSLELSNYRIRQVDIRAYSSIEGSEMINKKLMRQRAEAMIKGLKIYEPFIHKINILTAENWLDFFKDIDNTKFSDMLGLSKREIKQKLIDSSLASQIEPLLANERKVVATLYLESKYSVTYTTETTILYDFQNAINSKDVEKARAIQKELVDQIIDNKFPVEYINKIEVPQTREFSSLLNDREVYKYLLKATSEYEALNNFLLLKKLDQANGHISYNICALRFFMWQYGGDSLVSKILLHEINALPKQGINTLLVKRMQINYYILECEEQMNRFDYKGKDSSLSFIRKLYEELTLNDDEIYSLAKYYSFYAHNDWAEEIITPRIDKLDATENIIFYYVNLLFYDPSSFHTEEFSKAVLNAINLNRKRFCNFFLPNDKGGASMQLLEYEEIKKLYCEECK